MSETLWRMLIGGMVGAWIGWVVYPVLSKMLRR